MTRQSARGNGYSRDRAADDRRDGGVQVIARAADVLRALQGEPAGLSLSELARRVGLPKSTVHRLVTALLAEQFLAAASPSARVRLGPGLAAMAAGSSGELRDQLHPLLEDLSTSVDETVDLAVLEGDHVRFIDQIAAPHRLRAVSAIGERFALYCSANGKAILAALPSERARRLVPARLRAFTDKTITSRARLWEELDQIRSTGVAFDCEEHTAGISAVGIALQDAFGQLAAITIVVPTPRFAGNEQRLAERLRETRDAALRKLGAHS
jgi:DNA-binding IclR family transcriptional regulator